MQTRTRRPAGLSVLLASLVVLAQFGVLMALPADAAQPSVTNVTPISGGSNGGDRVTLTGSNFEATSHVTVDGRPAEDIKLVSGKLEFLTPARPSTTTTTAVTIRVVNPDGSVFNAVDEFSYTASPAPSITGISPASGPDTGSTSVTITGTNFHPRSTVAVGASCNAKWLVVSASPTQIIAASIGHAAGSVQLCVTNPDGKADTEANGFAFTPTPLPVVTNLSPGNGPTNGGTVVTIEGTNFSPAARVFFGTLSSEESENVVFVSPTRLQAVAPQHAAGVVSLRVQNSNGVQSATAQFQYIEPTSSQAPTVTAVGPSSGPDLGGTEVTVTGTNFHTGTNAPPRVFFGSIEADPDTVLVTSPTTLKVRAPANPCPAGSCPVVVRVDNPADAGVVPTSPNFEYRQPVRILGVSPATGTAGGGTTLTITGQQFSPSGNIVEVGGREAKVTSESPTSIVVLTPPHAIGPAVVEVTTVDGRGATYSNAFTYTTPAAFDLVSVSPLFGPTNGGTVLTLTGTGFQTGNMDYFPSVTIGGANAIVCTDDDEGRLGTEAVRSVAGCVAPVSATQLTVITPHRTGDSDAANQAIVVKNPDGATASSDGADNADDFDYQASANPTLAGLSPPTSVSGSAVGGTPVLITGTNFHDAPNAKPTVTVGGTAVKPESIVVLNGGESAYGLSCPADTKCLALVTPAKSGGAAAANQVVKVTNPAGDSVQSDGTDNSDDFDYTASLAPTVSTVAGSSSPNGGGILTITGANFGPVTRNAANDQCDLDGEFVKAPVTDTPVVLVGGTPSPLVCVQSSTVLRAIAPAGSAGQAVTVKVTNPDTRSGEKAAAFTYGSAPAQPVITPGGVTPSSAPLAGGARVTISGSNFGPPTVDTDGTTCTATSDYLTPGEVVRVPVPSVRFGGTPALDVCVNATGTQVTATVPARTTAGTVSISVVNPDGQQTSIGGFRYFGTAATPLVTARTPTSMSSNGGVSVTLTGSSFETAPAPHVYVGGAFVPLESNTATSLKFLAPHNAGNSDIHVVDANGQSAGFESAFTYGFGQHLSFAGLSPSFVSMNGGQVVTLTGNGFTSGSIVRVDGVEAERTSDAVTPSQIKFVAPNFAATDGKRLGPATIEVTNPDGKSLQILDRFGYTSIPGPSISSVTPGTLPATGGTLTVRGTNFASGATVTVGNSPCTGVSVAANNSQLTCTAPANNTAGAKPVTVSVNGQAFTLPNAVTYQASTSTGTGTSTSTGTGTSTSTGTGTTTGTGTSTNTGTGSSTSTFTSEGVTPASIQRANEAIRITVTRDGDANVVSFDLPAFLPGDVEGVQIWRSLSPFVLAATLDEDSAAYKAGEFRDEGAPEDASYLVTAYYGLTNALGFSNCAVGQTCEGAALPPGFAALGDGSGIGDGDGGVPTWVWVLAILAIVAIVVIVVVVRARKSGEAQPPAEGFAWNDPAAVPPVEVTETTASRWDEPVPAEAVGPEHTMRCPNCKTQFSARGNKPLVTRCPNCGKQGMLR